MQAIEVNPRIGEPQRQESDISTEFCGSDDSLEEKSSSPESVPNSIDFESHLRREISPMSLKPIQRSPSGRSIKPRSPTRSANYSPTSASSPQPTLLTSFLSAATEKVNLDETIHSDEDDRTTEKIYRYKDSIRKLHKSLENSHGKVRALRSQLFLEKAKNDVSVLSENQDDDLEPTKLDFDDDLATHWKAVLDSPATVGSDSETGMNTESRLKAETNEALTEMERNCETFADAWTQGNIQFQNGNLREGIQYYTLAMKLMIRERNYLRTQIKNRIAEVVELEESQDFYKRENRKIAKKLRDNFTENSEVEKIIDKVRLYEKKIEEIVQFKSKIKNLELQCSQYVHENENLKAANLDKVEHVRELNQMIKQMEEVTKILRSERSDNHMKLQKQKAKADQMLEQLTTKEDKISSLQTTLVQLTKKHKNMEQTLSDLAKRNKDLQNAEHEKRDLEHKISDLYKQKDNLEDSLFELKAIIAAKDEELQEILNKLSSTEKEVVGLVSENEELEFKLNDAVKDKVELRNEQLLFLTKTEELETMVRRNREEKEKLTNMIRQFEVKDEKSTQELSVLKASNQTLQAKIDSAQEECQKLRDLSSRNGESIENLEGTCDELRTQLKTKDEQVSAKKEQILSLEADLQLIKAEVEVSEANEANYQLARNKLKDQLDMQHSQILEKDKEIATLSQNLKNLEHEANNNAAKAQESSDKLQFLQLEKGEADKRLKAVEEELNQKVSELETKGREIESLSTSLKSSELISQRTAELDQLLVSSEAEIVELKTQVEKLKDESEEFRQQISYKEQVMQRLEEKCQEVNRICVDKDEIIENLESRQQYSETLLEEADQNKEVLEKLNKSNAKLYSEIEMRNEALRDLEKSLKKTCDESNEKVRSLEEKLALERKNFDDRFKAAKKELEEKTQQISTNEELLQKLQLEMNVTQSELEDEKAQSIAAREKMAQLEEDCKVLRNNSVNFEKETEKTRKEMVKWEEMMEPLNDKLSEYGSAIQAKELLITQKESVIKKLSSDMKDLETKNEDLKKQVGQSKDLEIENIELSARIVKLKKQVDVLENDLLNLEKIRGEHTKLKDRFEKLKNSSTSADAELTKKLVDITSELDTVSKQLLQFQEENFNLKNLYNDKDSELEMLRIDKNRTEQNIQDSIQLKGRIDELEKSLRVAIEKNTTLVAEFEDLSKQNVIEINTLSQKELDLKTKISQLEAEKEHLAAELSHTKENVEADVDHQIKSILAAKDRAEEALALLQGSLTEITNERNALIQKSSHIDEEKLQLSKELELLKQELIDKNSKMGSLLSEKASWNESLFLANKSAEESITSSKEEVEEMRFREASLASEVNSCLALFSALEERIIFISSAEPGSNAEKTKPRSFFGSPHNSSEATEILGDEEDDMNQSFFKNSMRGDSESTLMQPRPIKSVRFSLPTQMGTDAELSIICSNVFQQNLQLATAQLSNLCFDELVSPPNSIQQYTMLLKLIIQTVWSVVFYSSVVGGTFIVTALLFLIEVDDAKTSENYAYCTFPR